MCFFLTKLQHFSHRTDGHTGSATLQFLLQHQRLPHPPDGSGPGSSVSGQQGVPGGSGYAQCQQGATHSAYKLHQFAFFLESSLLFGMWHYVSKMQWSLIIQYFRVSAVLKNTDPLASICKEKGRMSDDRKGKTGGIMHLHPALSKMGDFCSQDRTMTMIMFEFHLSYSSLSRVNVPTLCGW